MERGSDLDRAWIVLGSDVDRIRSSGRGCKVNLGASEIGARLSPDCDFAMIWFYDHEDRNIKVSLRAFHDRIDVSEIAKKFAGGGHKKASGFTLPGDALVDDLFDVESDDLEEEPAEVLNEAVEEIKEEIEELMKKAEEAGVDVVLDPEKKMISVQESPASSSEEDESS